MLEQPILRRTVALAAATEAARLVTADGQAPVAGGHVLGPTYTAGKAGELTVTDLPADATLAAVIHLSKTIALGLSDIADLSSEFSISAAGKITNTGGTATTDGKLLVLWSTRRVTVGRALSAAAADGDDIQLLMIPN